MGSQDTEMAKPPSAFSSDHKVGPGHTSEVSKRHQCATKRRHTVHGKGRASPAHCLGWHQLLKGGGGAQSQSPPPCRARLLQLPAHRSVPLHAGHPWKHVNMKHGHRAGLRLPKPRPHLGRVTKRTVRIVGHQTFRIRILLLIS